MADNIITFESKSEKEKGHLVRITMDDPLTGETIVEDIECHYIGMDLPGFFGVVFNEVPPSGAIPDYLINANLVHTLEFVRKGE